MRVRALVNDKENIPAWLHWRIIEPYRKLRSNGYNADISWIEVGKPLFERVDILVVPRLIVEPDEQERVGNWLSDIRARGTKIVYEADDDIWSTSYVSTMTKIFAIENKLPQDKTLPVLESFIERTKWARWMLQQVDAITVSTSVLGAYVKTLVDSYKIPVYVVPNAINISRFKEHIEDREPSVNNLVYIGWAGGKRSYDDLRDMVEAWKRIARERDNVRFVVGGWQVPAILQNEAFANKIIKKPWTDVNHYAQSMQVDIGCCAVADSDFNRRKSTIKSWEFALAGAAVVASKTLYESEPLILLANDANDWYHQLNYFIDDEDARRHMQKIFENHVYGYHQLDFEYYRWVETYAMIAEIEVRDAVAS